MEIQPGEMIHPAGLEWEQLHKLGEQIVRLQDTPGQASLVEDSVSQLLGGIARLWLSQPYYPLPGEPDMPVLPSAPAPDFVQRAALTAAPVIIRADGKIVPLGLSYYPAQQAAFPLKAYENRLGVLELRCAPNQLLSVNDLVRLEGLVQTIATALEMSRQEKLKNWRYEQLALVRQVSAQIARLLEIDELCGRVTSLIQQTFHYSYVAIFTVENRPGSPARLAFRAAAHAADILPQDEIFEVALGEGITGTVAETGQQIVAPNVLIDPHYHFYEALPETLAEACFPLKIESQILGVLDVQSDQLNGIHDVDVLVLNALADNIAMALQNASLFSALQARASQISSIYEVSHALNSILDYDQLLDEIVQRIQKRFGYQHVHIFSVHPGRKLVIYQAGSGERSRAMQAQMISYPLDAEVGLIPHVARTRTTFLANDVTLEPLYIPADQPPHNTRAELVVPLVIGSEAIGVLDIQSAEPNVFGDTDRSLFEALGSTIAIALRNATLFKSEKWRRQVAESFRDVAYQITANPDLDSLLNSILERLESNLPCDAAAIWLVDNATEPAHLLNRTLRLAATRGVDPEQLTKLIAESPEISEQLTILLETSEPYVHDPKDPLGPLGQALNYTAQYSSIAVALRAGQHSLGLLTIAHHTSGRYGSEAQSMTATFASYAAAAIQNTRLYAEAQQQAWVSTMLAQVAEASQTTLTLDDLLATMLRMTRLLAGVRKCAFLLRGEGSPRFELKAWYGFEPPKGAPMWLPDTFPALLRLQNAHQPVFILNPGEELGLPELTLLQPGATLVMLPLLVRSELTGAFLIGLQTTGPSNTRESFDPRALTILQGIAHQTSVTVENLRLLEARQEEAYVTAALLQVAQAVVSAGDLKQVMENIIHLLPVLVGVDVCVVYLWEESAKTLRPAQAHAPNRRMEQNLRNKTYSGGGYRLLDAVMRSGTIQVAPLLDPESPPDAWSGLDSHTLASLAESSALPTGAWLLGFPLTIQDRILGVLLTREPKASAAFWERRMEIITGMAQQTSMAIQNDMLKHEMMRSERMEREIQLARQIQETFLPDFLPTLPGWELDVRWETARQVGGDFYDVFDLENGKIGLVIADVSDKGLPAALYMTVTRTLIRSKIHEHASPAKVLCEVNAQLFSESPESMFITAIYAVLDPASGELIYANAGHNLPLIFRQSSQTVEQLPKGGTALGVIHELQLENHTIAVWPGDILVLFTDGACDTLGPDGEDFGEPRLRAVLEKNNGCSAANLLEALDFALEEFRQDMPPFDDVTLIAVRRIVTTLTMSL
jgi:sigma-B regulation protein RsbU (phosphoserine phosphatase)